MAVLKNDVAITIRVRIQKTLFRARQRLAVRIVGKYENVLDPAADQIHAFDEVNLFLFAQFLKQPRRQHRELIARFKHASVLDGAPLCPGRQRCRQRHRNHQKWNCKGQDWTNPRHQALTTTHPDCHFAVAPRSGQCQEHRDERRNDDQRCQQRDDAESDQRN